ncbi:exported hypothetical protein [Candidatus Zixiibacteriota bacterium]|nr:exported hypothetical protein [candidate division Zixibacteria bacterium]
MRLIIITGMILAALGSASAQTGSNAALDSIITKVIAVRDAEIAQLNNLKMDAVSYEKREDGDGNVKETKKYIKTVFLKKGPDGKFAYSEEYTGYFVDGIRQDDKQLPKVAEERADRKKKRGGKDIAFDIVSILRPEMRKYYTVTYDGLAPKPVDDFPCYVIRAVADTVHTVSDILDTLVNITYYIDMSSYHVVRAEFAPASLISRFMFKMSELDMSLDYEPYDETIWLPRRFHIKGRAKAMYFMGIYFEGEEIYSNPVVNDK